MRDIILDGLRVAALSSFFIAWGLRILLAKRPFIVDSRLYGILCIAPLMIGWIELFLSEYTWQDRQIAFSVYVATGCMAILLVLILWAPWGGIVIGATETTLRDALRTAFSRLGLSYEESAKAFRLPALNNELVSRAHFDGMFTIWFRRFRGLHAMRQLARQLSPEVKEFFKTAPVRINKRLGYALVVIGVAFLIFCSWLTYVQLSLESKMRATREAHTEFFKSPEK